MRRVLFLNIFLLFALASFGQLNADKLEVRFGYHLHNAYAKRFNDLINTFNNTRYPFEIDENLSNINFLKGFQFGGNYRFREDMFIHIVLKNKHQFLQAPYVDNQMYRQYLFRENTLEAGLSYQIKEERWFSHYVGVGVVVGYMSAFTNWTDTDERPANSEMTNIAHTTSLGLAASYEAQFKLHPCVRLSLRPVAQFTLNSFVRNLDAFMNPQVSDGNVTFEGSGEVKPNKGSLSGLGIEGGLILSLPK